MSARGEPGRASALGRTSAAPRPRLSELDELRRAMAADREAWAGFSEMLSRVEERLRRLEDQLAALGVDEGNRASMSRPVQAVPRPPHGRPASDAGAAFTFSGRIHGQMVPDMLQLASSNRMTGVFTVEVDGSEVRLYFEEGKIFHAVGPDLVGERAFFAVFGAESGTYRFEECTELPPERTLTQSTQFLILEALRRIDEDAGQ